MMLRGPSALQIAVVGNFGHSLAARGKRVAQVAYAPVVIAHSANEEVVVVAIKG
jgi:hypothetical protein